MQFRKKDLLGIKQLEPEEIQFILETAETFKEISTRAIKKVPTLRGRTVVHLFYEPSTRTRSPSSSNTSVGVMEDRGRLPGVIWLATEPVTP